MRLFAWLDSIRQPLLSRSLRSRAKISRRRMVPGARQPEVLETRILLTSDFGDAPLPYPTTVAENGAQHTATGPMLGTIRDSEANGVHSATATVDDTTGTPGDEDGVTFGAMRVGALGATATVVTSNASSGAKLDAWIDFNGDGNWGGSQEQIANHVAVVNGNNSITFDVPSDALDGTTFARFRLNTAGNLGPNGIAADGEVEDHAVTIIPPLESSGKFRSPISIAADSANLQLLSDLDGDGDLDILVANRQIAWLENDGSAHFTTHVIANLALNSVNNGVVDLEIVDLDGDGDNDIVTAMPEVDRVEWFENDGRQSFSAHTITTSTDYVQAIDVADMDRDGDLDVLSASYSDRTIAWFENDGHNSFVKRTVTTQAANAYFVAACDLDRDGDLDVIWKSLSGFLSWSENHGSETFTTRTISTTPHYDGGVVPIDFDSDGDMDVLATIASDDNLIWYENDGLQNFTARPSLAWRTKAFSVADADGDGDFDVVYASNYSGGILWLINDGSSHFTSSAMEGRAYTYAVLPGDVNGDGALDVVIGSDVFGIGWYQNKFDATPPAVQITPLIISGPTTLTFQFSESVTGFTASDISLRNGTASVFTAVDADTYTLLISPSSNKPIDVTIAANSLQDSAGNGNLATSVSVAVDRTAPTLTITPDVTRTNDSPIRFAFQFSEVVSGFTATDISLINSLPGTFTAVDGDTYTLDVIPTQDSLVTVTVGGNAAQDPAGNGNWASSASVTSDRIPPEVTSFTRVDDGLNNLSSVSWTLLFDDDVTGVNTSDFSLVSSGASGVYILYVTGSGTSYTVVASTGSGDGTLGIELVDDDSIVDVAGNPLKGVGTTGANSGSYLGQAYTVDKTPPMVTSLARVDSTPTTAGSVSWTIRFRESVIAVDAADFTLLPSGLTGVSIASVTGTGSTWTVTASIGPSQGTLGLQLVDDDTILDTAGNPLGGSGTTGPNNGSFTGETYTIDTLPPTVTSFTRVAASRTNASTLSWTLVLSENVNGLDAGDFSLLPAGLTGVAIVSVSGSGTTYTVTATTGTGEGTLGIKLLDNDSIVDLSLKPLGGSGTDDGSMVGTSYLLDHTAPTLASFERWYSSDGETNADELSFRVSFRDPVTEVDSSDFVVNGLTTATVTAVREVEGSDGRQFEVLISGGDLPVYNGPVGLSLRASQNITDYAGNSLPTAEPTIDETYLLNDTLPEYFVRQVKDINTLYGSDPRQFTVVGNTLFFTADDGIHGRELWKSDGTAAGTVMVKDIAMGAEWSGPVSLTSFNGELYFFVGQHTGGTELWKSDGTESGTMRVRTIDPLLWNSLLEGRGSVAVSNGMLFFAGPDAAHGTELWKSDGTTAGTMLVKDIVSGSGSSGPLRLTDVNGTLFFNAWEGIHGSELWKSDGTVGGTVMVADVTAGATSTLFEEVVALNNTLYFVANNGLSGWELWKSNGTAAGTGLVKDIRPGSGHSRPKSLTNVNGTLFFSADTSPHGRELWKSNGTAAGTVRLTDVTVGSGSLSPSRLTNLNGMLYFLGEGGYADTRLWNSDGTTAGTTQVFTDLPDFPLFFHGLAEAGGKLFFTVRDYALFVTDGTEAGTSIVSEQIDELERDEYAQALAVVDGNLFFTVDAAGDGERELYRITTTPPLPTEPHLLLDIFPGPEASYADEFASINGLAYFSTNNGVEQSLWRTDGTAGGTQIVRNFADPSYSFGLNELESVNDSFFFSANDGVHGYELWKSDGTSANTILVKDIAPQTDNQDGSSAPQSLTNVNGTLFFVAADVSHGRELWKSDGTEAGTVLVADIYVGDGSSSPNLLTAVNDLVFFVANDGVHGDVLWVSDGTVEGTRRVKDQWVTPAGWSYLPPTNLTNVNGTLFFTMQSGLSSESLELWKSDGTADGTVMVRNGFSGAGLNNLTALNGELLFFASEGRDRQLWKSDGTAEGTVVVAPGQFESPYGLTNLGDAVFFRAFTETAGDELWKTDGTSAGTKLFADVVPGDQSSYPSSIVSFDDAIYFTNGYRLWKTDGTPDGTEISLRNGQFTEELRSLTSTGNALLFTAKNEISGREVWVVNAPDTTNPTVTSIQRDNSNAVESGSVRWKVVFSEPVRGVHLDDFQLATTGFTGARITSFVGSGTTYFVTATTGTGEGTLQLRLADNDSIVDAFQNPLGGAGTVGDGDGSFIGETFNLDFSPPTVMSFVCTASNRTNASSVSWTVAFSETVTGLDVGDFALLPSGVSGASIVSVAGSGMTYTVVANTGTGGGTLGIKLVDDDSVADIVGHPLKGPGTTGINSGSYLGKVYTIDRTPSKVTSISRVDTTPTNAGSVSWTVRFRENVTGVDAADFALLASGLTGVSLTSVTGMGYIWTVTANTGIGEGTLGLKLVDDDSISDAAGNSLGGAGTTGPNDGSFNGEVYAVDTVPPTATSIQRTGTKGTNASNVSWTVLFTESVSGVDASDFSLLPSGVSGASITSVTGSGTTFTITASTGSGNGTLGINLLDDDSITDTVGNRLKGTGTTGLNNGSLTGQVYTIDRTVPSTTSFLRQTPGTNPTNADAFVFRAKFSETVSNVDTADFVVNGSTTATVTSVTAVSGSNGKQYDVTISGGDLPSFTGTMGLNVSASATITDLAGNVLPAIEPTTDQTFTIIALQDLTFTASGTAVLTAAVVSGRLQVRIGGVLQTGFDPAFVRSLTITGAGGADVIDLTGLSRSAYSRLTRIVLNGGAQNDTITGSADFDETISGGAGNDSLNGAGGTNTLIESGDVSFTLTNVSLMGVGTDTLANFQVANLTGGASSNTFTVSGWTGSGYIAGLTGTDQIVVLRDTDMTLANSSLVAAGFGTLVLASIETARLSGGDAANVIRADRFTRGAVTVQGGNGDDVLIGGSRNDSLTGGAGRDLLIGGLGADTLGGDAGDDILLGGTSSLNGNVAALNAIMAEWVSANSYATRVANLFNGGGANGTTKLNSATVQNDSSAIDRLTGGSATDWFLQSSGDVLRDFDATEIKTTI